MSKEDVENRIVSILRDEVQASTRAQDTQDFESAIDLLECVRSEKEYEWMADYFIPESSTILLADAANWTSRYFPNRDFVEVKLEDDNPANEKKCKAAKLLINKTLNARHLYYYLKYNRARFINSLGGIVWGFPRWEQKTEIDEAGNEHITVDRFNFDIPDPRNVFPSPEYCYSAQEKKYIVVREETTYEDLLENQNTFGYINLDKVKEVLEAQTTETETSKESVNKEGLSQRANTTPIKLFDVYMRLGKIWAVVKKTQQVQLYDRSWEEITEIDYGYDDAGKPKKNAKLVEAMVAFAHVGQKDILVRFQATPYYDSEGRPYKPAIRGLCYPHPTKDSGLGDGKYLVPLQTMLNDSYNMGYDRQKLAMLPTLKIKKYSNVENDTIYIAPEHAMELEDPKDVEELVIRDNMTAALQTVTAVMGFMDRLTSVTPPKMGSMPEKSGTTATAVVNAEQNSDVRANFKDMTFEYTFNCELYWFINQMSFRFMQPSTAQKILGDHVKDYDPDPDYTYTPVSSNIETEYNKQKTLSLIDQFIGRVAGVKHPSTPKLVNYLLSRAFDLYGDRFPGYKAALFDESQPIQGVNSTADYKSMPTSNQTGMEISPMEGQAREGAAL